jgi:hypothetical protein
VKLGAENRPKLIAAVVLGILAVFLFLRFLSGLSGGSPSTAVAAAPSAHSTGGRIIAHAGKRVAAGPRSLDPTLRYDWLKVSEDTKYEGRGRNIFRAEVDIPKPIVSPVKPVAVVQQPTGPPPPPPINLKFFGYSNHPGEAKKIFLEKGEDIFVAREGDIIDRRYRILHIMPNAVEVEDVLNNNRQSIPLTQG